jgi:hypothetical protein
VSFDEITNEIDNCRPVAIGITIQEPDETYAHDVSVIGYKPEQQLLYIADPHGFGDYYSYSAIKNGNCSYVGGSKIIGWRLTCFTRA